jgi:hypothetical protein
MTRTVGGPRARGGGGGAHGGGCGGVGGASGAQHGGAGGVGSARGGGGGRSGGARDGRGSGGGRGGRGGGGGRSGGACDGRGSGGGRGGAVKSGGRGGGVNSDGRGGGVICGGAGGGCCGGVGGGSCGGVGGSCGNTVGGVAALSLVRLLVPWAALSVLPKALLLAVACATASVFLDLFACAICTTQAFTDGGILLGNACHGCGTCDTATGALPKGPKAVMMTRIESSAPSALRAADAAASDLTTSNFVGVAVGCAVGVAVGCAVGAAMGGAVGAAVGGAVGAAVCLDSRSHSAHAASICDGSIMRKGARTRADGESTAHANKQLALEPQMATDAPPPPLEFER